MQCKAFQSQISHNFFSIIALSAAFNMLMGVAFADEANLPKPFNVGEHIDLIASVATQASKVFALDPQRVIRIEGEVEISAPVIAAREIVFRPGGRLVLRGTPDEMRADFYIVTDRISAVDPASPGSITWEPPVPNSAPDRGRAPGGSRADRPGADGGPGADGAQGLAGQRGHPAPSLMIFARTLPDGLHVNLQGGTGGAGGKGQDGGEGADGVRGEPAKQEVARVGVVVAGLPACAAGPGRGGRGGNGGRGGTGGTGGAGGAGGTLVMISVASDGVAALRHLRIDTSGGNPGSGGEGGSGGGPGSGGPEGQLANFCGSAGREGAAGTPGPMGPIGHEGVRGKLGETWFSMLTSTQFENLFGL